MIEENELPQGWVWTTLEEVTNPVRNSIQPSENPTLPFVGLEHVASETMKLLSTSLTGDMKSLVGHFNSGDVLYGRLRPYLNKVIRPDFEGTCSAEFLVFPKSTNLKSRYLQYFLNSWHFRDFASHLNTGDRPRVNWDQLKHFSFPLPPLAEQHRIVEAIEQQFSRLDAGIASLRSAQKKLKLYRASVLKAAVEGELTAEWRAANPPTEPASVLLERILKERRERWEYEQRAKGRDPKKVNYVEPAEPDVDELPNLPEGWCWATVEQLASSEPRAIQSGPFGSSLLHSEFQETGILAIGIDNVLDGQFSMGRQHRISLQKYEELKKYTARPLDFVITVMATVGRCCVIPEDIETSIITKHVYRITLNKILISPYFLMYCFLGDEQVRRQLFGQVQGQTRPGINGEILKKITIPIPSLREQEEIISYLEERLSHLKELETTIEKALKRAEIQRQSILHQAFTGKLVPQDPDDEPASVLLERIQQERDQSSKKVKGNSHGAARKRAVRKEEPVRVQEAQVEPIDTRSLVQQGLW